MATDAAAGASAADFGGGGLGQEKVLGVLEKKVDTKDTWDPRDACCMSGCAHCVLLDEALGAGSESEFEKMERELKRKRESAV